MRGNDSWWPLTASVQGFVRGALSTVTVFGRRTAVLPEYWGLSASLTT
jgi:hypothetical protein